MKLPGLPRHVVRVVLVLVVALALQGCAKINHLHDAQNAFSDAAALENRLTLNLLDRSADGPSRADVEAQIRAGYASVLASLANAEDDQGATLKKNRLYGNLLMLKAMTYWRLRDTTRAEEAATAAANLPDDQIFPRDRAMAHAMGGLIRNSQAHAIVAQPFDQGPGMNEAAADALKKAAHEEVAALIKSAVEIYDKVIARLASRHELVVYLNEAKLAAYKNELDSSAKFRPGKLTDIAKIKSALEKLKDSMCAVEKLAGRGEPLPSVDFARLVSWALTLGVAVPDNRC